MEEKMQEAPTPPTARVSKQKGLPGVPTRGTKTRFEKKSWRRKIP